MQVLIQLRAVIYDCVSTTWNEAIVEKNRIELLGVDYRSVTDRLGTLKTPVGGILLAAVDNLSTNSPEKWSLSALACRNVIITLSELWKDTSDIYITKSGEELQLKGDKEKNRLFAYIDTWSRKVSPEQVSKLEEARSLIIDIYRRGSKGKRVIQHSEARDLVVITFRLVDLLTQVTDLQPFKE
jgi:hypothetical protein